METLASDLGLIVNDSKFSDCQFLLEGKQVVYAHKAIICARSDYFKAMFVENTRESMSTVSFTTLQEDYKFFAIRCAVTQKTSNLYFYIQLEISCE